MKLLLLEEVAREARVSTETVRYWIRTRKLASVRPGRRRLVRRDTLDRFLTLRATGNPQGPEGG